MAPGDAAPSCDGPDDPAGPCRPVATGRSAHRLDGRLAIVLIGRCPRTALARPVVPSSSNVTVPSRSVRQMRAPEAAMRSSVEGAGCP